RRLGLATSVEDRGLAVPGMRLTGANGVAIEGRYPNGRVGRAIVRRDLDWWLLQAAISAGVRFESGLRVRRALVEECQGRASLSGSGAGRRVRSDCPVRAPVTIAADGRHSSIAFGLDLARHLRRPRRWAIGAYFTDVGGLTPFGEMHVRGGRFIGVAALP